MKIKIAFIVVILAALVGLGGSQLIAAHHSAGHGAHQSKKEKAIEKCKKDYVGKQQRNCIRKVRRS